ncbi:MAG: glycosyl transferase, partial [Muribaculaceae bacterium]|nr:glycosyl transferase [Muribaculaceae bacterium]
MIIATSGRCEYRNKGLDLFLDMLATMEYSMTPDDRDVLAFVLVPAWARAAREDLRRCLSDGVTVPGGLAAPVITHELNNPGEDVILNRIRSFGVSRMNESKVHVVYVPCYLDGKDGIVDMPYYDVLPGLDATVFASYYEPWGYTPLESVAFGVPTVTTSLSGFGQWVSSSRPGEGLSETGVEVVKRTDSNYSHVISEIMGTLRRISEFDRSEKSVVSAAAMATADRAAWNYFIEYYVESYGIALKAASSRVSGTESSKKKISKNSIYYETSGK